MKVTEFAMTERHQVTLVSLLISATVIWLYYYVALDAPELMAQYDYHAAVIWDEPWRLLTAHFLHLSTTHWVLNTASFVVICGLFARYFSVRSYLNALIVITLMSSIALWLVGYDGRFVGLSGLNHGLLVMCLLLERGAATTAKQQQLMVAILAVIGVKLLLEFLGVWPSSLEVGQVRDTWQLHGAGILAGVLAWWLHERHLAKLAQRN